MAARFSRSEAPVMAALVMLGLVLLAAGCLPTGLARFWPLHGLNFQAEGGSDLAATESQHPLNSKLMRGHMDVLYAHQRGADKKDAHSEEDDDETTMADGKSALLVDRAFVSARIAPRE